MSIRSNVEHFFIKHPNEKCFLKDFAEELYDGPVEDAQRAVQQSISYIMRNGLMPGLEVVHSGQCWIYKSNSNDSSDPTFKVLGEGTDKTVLMDNEGNIWIAKKVDI